MKTYITYNKGRDWRLLQAPSADLRGNRIHCMLVSGLVGKQKERELSKVSCLKFDIHKWALWGQCTFTMATCQILAFEALNKDGCFFNYKHFTVCPTGSFVLKWTDFNFFLLLWIITLNYVIFYDIFIIYFMLPFKFCLFYCLFVLALTQAFNLGNSW